MASGKNDSDSEKVIAEEVHVSSSNSEENVDTTARAPPPSSAPTSTPTVQGGVEDQNRGVAMAGGAVEATSMEVPTTGEAQNVQTAPPAGGEQSATEKRKRKRVEDAGASSSGGRDPKKPRRKGDFHDEPDCPPTCYVCGKLFKTWRGVFGHMRAHKVSEGRQRGALPPPVPTSPSGEASTAEGSSGGDAPRLVFQEQLLPALLNIAQEVLVSPASASSSYRLDGLDIDLNQPIVSEEEEEGRRFDLNKPPPPEDKEGDKDKDDGAAPN